MVKDQQHVDRQCLLSEMFQKYENILINENI